MHKQITYTDIKTLGQLLRNRRKSLNLNQQELADLCNLSLNGISKIERGDSDIRISTLQKIGQFLGIQIILRLEE